MRNFDYKLLTFSRFAGSLKMCFENHDADRALLGAKSETAFKNIGLRNRTLRSV